MSRLHTLDPRRFLPAGVSGWLPRSTHFSAREVRHLLREGGDSVRGRAVSRVLGRTSDWLPEEPDMLRCPYHYWRQLPQIVIAYSRGDSEEAIARRISVWETPWGVDRVLQTACRNIAACLNRDPAAYGLT